MLFAHSEKKTVESLREDAAKMVGDIVQLKNQLAEMSRAKTQDVAADLSSRWQDQSEAVAAKIDLVGKGVNAYLKTVEGQFKTKPYPFLLGTLAVGIACGLLVPFMLRER